MLTGFICENWRILLALFILQGLFGVFWFELTWRSIERLRKGQEECWREFPMYRRLDNHMWSRSAFYPGAFLLLTSRLIGSFGLVFLVGILQRLLFLGQPMDEPLSGWRRTAHKRMLWIVTPAILLCWGYTVDYTELNKSQVDYSKYLGANWREDEFKGKRVSTIVANHSNTVLEILSYIAKMPVPPSFTPAHFVKQFPIGDHYCRALQAIYIDRTQGQDGRDLTVEAIVERQKLTEVSDKDWGPLCIFAEGGLTNGKCLGRFRRGAFASGLAVRPTLAKHDYNLVNPDMCNIKFWECGILMKCATKFSTTRVYSYPAFVPNDYLYTEYAKTIDGYEKMEKWEIYAHAVHDFLKQQGGFDDATQPLREKVLLNRFLWREIDELTIHGKTFYWPPRPVVLGDADKDK